MSKLLFGNKESNFSFSWNGKNTSKARMLAASNLVNFVLKNSSKDPREPITLVGHSHGGNVAILAINMMKKMKQFEGRDINLVTINTPVRPDYQLKDKTVNHLNIFDNKDPVQERGGNDPTKFVDKIESQGHIIAQDGDRNGNKFNRRIWGRWSEISNAINVETTVSRGMTGDFHNSHNHSEDWLSKLPDPSWFE